MAADFSSSYLSDTDESAVDELISQAEDLVALEHLSSLNLSSSSVLPSHLDSRFQNLKSFPPRMPLPYSSPSRLLRRGESRSKSDILQCSSRIGREPRLGELGDDDGHDPHDDEDGERYGGSGLKSDVENMGKHKHKGRGNASSGSDSSGYSGKDEVFTPQKATPVAKSKRAALSGGPRFTRGSGSGSDSPASASPPRKGGCFWCSPKSKSPRKNKGLDMGWGKHEELLSDLGSFSVKEQRRVLKEAMKEQERLSREAEKIVRIAKQASARMQIHGDSSDDDDHTKL